jgi:sortase A
MNPACRQAGFNFMTYRYVKAPPGYTLAKPVSIGIYVRKTFSAVLLTLGIAAFTSVIYPMMYYQAHLAPRLESSTTLSNPLADATPKIAEVKSAHAAEPTYVKEMINTTLDYTDSANWFPEAAAPTVPELPDKSYALSIPTLGINEATVVTSHTDLKKSLIQYPGTALPGDLGNTVIFGHSVLPQFFNPHNYLTIFSTLHTLKKGDEIDITADGVSYRYMITDMYQVEPDNLQPLAQSYDAHHLTLITCTPPGTYLRRLIIKADLQ